MYLFNYNVLLLLLSPHLALFSRTFEMTSNAVAKTQSLPLPLILMLMMSVSLSLPCNLSRFMWSEVFTSWIYKHQPFSYLLIRYRSLCLCLSIISFTVTHSHHFFSQCRMRCSLATTLKWTSTIVNTQTRQRLNAHFANVIKRIHGKLYNLLKFSERSILLCVSLIHFTRFYQPPFCTVSLSFIRNRQSFNVFYMRCYSKSDGFWQIDFNICKTLKRTHYLPLKSLWAMHTVHTHSTHSNIHHNFNHYARIPIQWLIKVKGKSSFIIFFMDFFFRFAFTFFARFCVVKFSSSSFHLS